jgi:hypothetical protein
MSEDEPKQDINLLVHILNNEQQMLQRADQKALTLLSIIGVFAVFFMIHYTKIVPSVLSLVLVCIYFFFVLITILFILMVIVPRFKKNIGIPDKMKRRFIPFSITSRKKFSTFTEYLKDFYNVEEEVTIDHNLITQAILALGKINSYKNRFLRYSIITFSIAITAEIAIIILLYWTIVFK